MGPANSIKEPMKSWRQGAADKISEQVFDTRGYKFPKKLAATGPRRATLAVTLSQRDDHAEAWGGRGGEQRGDASLHFPRKITQ